MEASVEQFKERARATWAAGNFDEIAKTTLDVGRKVAAAAEIEAGMRVLDVACGSGNATIPAALAGGRCTGLYLVPSLLAAAAGNAAAAGVAIEWVEGDAEALPFADGSFERVLSMFGVMFAPRHEVAAAELARVCAPGGRIVVAAWTPEGMIGQMFRTVSSRMPPAPSYASPPPLWGSEDHVRSLLEPHGFDVQAERAMAVFRGASVEDVVARMEKYFGPWRMAQQALGDDWAPLRAQLYDLYAGTAEPMDEGGIGSFGEYLLVRATKSG
jgi:ubiquinone/menaquinone biosynthesis C-methylase UbiE